MSKPVNRLEAVKQVFANRENALAQELGAFQRDLKQAEQQLRQLRSYRDQNSGQASAITNIDPNRLQNEQAFRQRLNDAIAQQEQLIQRARIEGAQLRQRWLAKRRKTLSVQKLFEQREHRQLQEEADREQKQQDEAASRTDAPRGIGKL